MQRKCQTCCSIAPASFSNNFKLVPCISNLNFSPICFCTFWKVQYFHLSTVSKITFNLFFKHIWTRSIHKLDIGSFPFRTLTFWEIYQFISGFVLLKQPSIIPYQQHHWRAYFKLQIFCSLHIFQLQNVQVPWIETNIHSDNFLLLSYNVRI